VRLVERERSLFNLDITIYLYDLTSTYFEGVCSRNPKAKRGHSRDHRPDCKQVVVALVINRDGFSITHEVFAGNTQDRATLATMLVLTARAASSKAQPWWLTAAWRLTRILPRSSGANSGGRINAWTLDCGAPRNDGVGPERRSNNSTHIRFTLSTEPLRKRRLLGR
jgi:hypothetical protein